MLRVGGLRLLQCGSVPAVVGTMRTIAARSSRIRLSNFRSFSHSDFETKRKVPVPEDSAAIKELIAEQIQEHKVMVYMKGTPSMPQCGFSQQVVRILHATGVEFASVNVLEDDGIRQGIKDFSQWPTIPQLYINGEFVGGCDIVTQAFQSGELEETLIKAGAIEPIPGVNKTSS